MDECGPVCLSPWEPPGNCVLTTTAVPRSPNCSKVASSARQPYNDSVLQDPTLLSIGGETVSTGLQGGRCVPRTMPS